MTHKKNEPEPIVEIVPLKLKKCRGCQQDRHAFHFSKANHYCKECIRLKRKSKEIRVPREDISPFKIPKRNMEDFE